ncbi:MAG TPA: tape measure protein, partial [Tissierellaceae bacterium]|nr:tape measure protein [Tissierellaceae bacterium]
MATIKNTITMQDRMTPVLRTIIKSLQSTVDAMAGVDHVSNTSFRRAQRDVQAASEALDQFNNNLDEIPPRVDNVGSGFSKWKMGIIAANQALELGKKVVGAIANQLTDISDMTDQQSRLRAMLDEGEGVYDMQQLITRSAMDTRSAYEDTLESAVQMKAAMSEYGMSTQAAVRMSELMNKSLTLGGTKGAAAQSVMYNLQQSLATGQLRWEDWKIVASNSVYLADVVAKNVGVTRAQLNQMVQDGEISAADFTNALLEAGARIDEEFEMMPDTFADWVNNIKTFATGKFLEDGGLHEKILEMLASDQFLAMVEGIKNAIVSLLDFLGVVLDYVLMISEWIGNNWGIIAPIIWGIVAAFAAYEIIMIASAIATWIANGAAQAFFVTLLTNPLTWIILLIGLVVAAVYKWVQSVGGLQNAWEIAKAAIVIALIALKIAFFTSIYFIMDLVDKLVMAWKSAGVAIANFLGTMKVNVLSILQGMINGAIDLINKFIGVLNKIPGVSIDAVNHVSFAAEAAATEEAARQSRESDLSAYKSEMEAKAAERDSKLGAMKNELADATKNLSNLYAASKSEANKKAEEDIPFTEASANDLAYKDMMNAAGNPTIKGGKLDKVGKIKDDVSITDEDIKLLKDVAQTEFINKFTTLRPEMQVSFGDVKETADV